MEIYNKGAPETEFAEGIYQGSITLPIEYHMKPPYIYSSLHLVDLKLKKRSVFHSQTITLNIGSLHRPFKSFLSP
jgi:ubiquitin-protein ligase